MTEHAVVIAGGGPTGLMLAGVDVAMVERRASQNLPGARAGGLHARTIEVLDQRAWVDGDRGCRWGWTGGGRGRLMARRVPKPR